MGEAAIESVMGGREKREDKEEKEEEGGLLSTVTYWRRTHTNARAHTHPCLPCTLVIAL